MPKAVLKVSFLLVIILDVTAMFVWLAKGSWIAAQFGLVNYMCAFATMMIVFVMAVVALNE